MKNEGDYNEILSQNKDDYEESREYGLCDAIDDDENFIFKERWHKKNNIKKSAYVIAIMSILNFIKHGASKLSCGIYLIKKDYDGSPTKETCALLGIPVRIINDLLFDDTELVKKIRVNEELNYIEKIDEITTRHISKAIGKFLPFFRTYGNTDLVLLNIEPKGYGKYERYYPTPRITIPGGKMERNDFLNFESCGFREFREETGLDIASCHEKISREKIKSGKRFTHLSSFQKRIKYLPARKQQEILTKFESVYYLVNIK